MWQSRRDRQGETKGCGNQGETHREKQRDGGNPGETDREKQRDVVIKEGQTGRNKGMW